MTSTLPCHWREIVDSWPPDQRQRHARLARALTDQGFEDADAGARAAEWILQRAAESAVDEHGVPRSGTIRRHPADSEE